MIIILLIISAIVLIFLLIKIRSFFPAYLNLGIDDLFVHVEALYRRGYDEGQLVIKPLRTSHVYIARKRIHSRGKISLEVEYPFEPWPESFHGYMEQYLKENNLNGTRIGKGHTLSVIQVDCKESVQVCNALCGEILLKLSDLLSTPQRFSLDFSGISQEDERIGF